MPIRQERLQIKHHKERQKGYYIVIKQLIQVRGTPATNISIYTPSIGASINGHKGFCLSSNSMIAGHFNTTVTSVDRSFTQKINMENMALYVIFDQTDLIDIPVTFHPKTADYTFSSNVHRTFFGETTY